jgi:UDPglucose--hexose-1-phosphate uridylyltransferase
MSELRRDPLTGGWVIIAKDRGLRPSDFGSVAAVNRGGFCPFCPGNESTTPPEVASYRKDGTSKNSPGWTVRTIPNKYAALHIEGDLDREGMGVYDKMQGIGAHEVIIETPDHDRGMADFTPEELVRVIRMYRERVNDLRRDSRFRYIQIFKNHGSVAGASLEHSHSQVIALPMTPRWVKQELNCSKEYYDIKERCLLMDIIRQEMREKERAVHENGSFFAFCPYAAKFPFETWIVPKTQQNDFCLIEDKQMKDLAEILLTVLRGLRRGLEDPPYNFIVHSAPSKYPRAGYWDTIDEDFLWHIEMIPRLTRIAGFEWGTGCHINPTPPEQSAEFLREMIQDLKEERKSA